VRLSHGCRADRGSGFCAGVERRRENLHAAATRESDIRGLLPRGVRRAGAACPDNDLAHTLAAQQPVLLVVKSDEALNQVLGERMPSAADLIHRTLFGRAAFEQMMAGRL
jgi:hypothetical protein